MDVVIIVPEKGRAKEIGRQLLDLADSPTQVQWVTWPQAGYQIPLILLERFDAANENADTAAPPTPEVMPKRRGRPRKEQSTDNTPTAASEEE